MKKYSAENVTCYLRALSDKLVILWQIWIYLESPTISSSTNNFSCRLAICFVNKRGETEKRSSKWVETSRESIAHPWGREGKEEEEETEETEERIHLPPNFLPCFLLTKCPPYVSKFVWASLHFTHYLSVRLARYYEEWRDGCAFLTLPILLALQIFSNRFGSVGLSEREKIEESRRGGGGDNFFPPSLPSLKVRCQRDGRISFYLPLPFLLSYPSHHKCLSAILTQSLITVTRLPNAFTVSHRHSTDKSSPSSIFIVVCMPR